MKQVMPVEKCKAKARQWAWTGLNMLLGGALLASVSAATQAQTFGPWPDAAVHAPTPITPPPIPRPSTPAPYSGYTKDGTLFMGGQMIGNPHQILHDMQNPSLFDVQATRLSNTSDPTFGQGALAQMETHMHTLLPTAPNELFTRLYVDPTNPYPQTPIGSFNNYLTYNEVIANTQQASYQLTVANDNNLWAFKTLAAPNSQAMNILIKELPAHQNFISAKDPAGGAVGVKVNSNGDAAALQNYLATTKPYDFAWRSAMGAWADGTARPNNINAGLGAYANAPIGNNEAGAVFFYRVARSNDVQAIANNLATGQYSEATVGVRWDPVNQIYFPVDATGRRQIPKQSPEDTVTHPSPDALPGGLPAAIDRRISGPGRSPTPPSGSVDPTTMDPNTTTGQPTPEQLCNGCSISIGFEVSGLGAGSLGGQVNFDGNSNLGVQGTAVGGLIVGGTGGNVNQTESSGSGLLVGGGVTIGYSNSSITAGFSQTTNTTTTQIGLGFGSISVEQNTQTGEVSSVNIGIGPVIGYSSGQTISVAAPIGNVASSLHLQDTPTQSSSNSSDHSNSNESGHSSNVGGGVSSGTRSYESGG